MLYLPKKKITPESHYSLLGNLIILRNQQFNNQQITVLIYFQAFTIRPVPEACLPFTSNQFSTRLIGKVIR
ncbi:hypothetical protein SAMN05421545_1060 [Pontibacter lucknowensis]|uniref:Uncharacterized protein n=1 Tax=Pontibacter lucknowensis TaxID=1077936 RepID=A0A1N6UTJ3_9BACT|nr:hypothetical protein SAMN05421545_1060 [Pontibacter lucknowensis]